MIHFNSYSLSCFLVAAASMIIFVSIVGDVLLILLFPSVVLSSGSSLGIVLKPQLPINRLFPVMKI